MKTKPLALDILKMRYSVSVKSINMKRKRKKNIKQRNDTSQGITGNVLHFKSCTKKKM